MKRKKIIALLCVAATSASLVTPVMAEENQATGNYTGSGCGSGSTSRRSG